MENKQKTTQPILLVLLCVLIITGISFLFISQMNEMIQSNTLNTISELAEHDLNTVQRFVETKWYELHNIKERIDIYKCSSIEETQEKMYMEASTSDFRTLYLIAEDGSIYTDRGTVYTPDEIEVGQYIESGEEQTVRKYDLPVDNGYREMLFYAIRLEDHAIEGTKFVALAGLTDIEQVQENLVVYSFVKDNKKRGYSSVVNPGGEYIVNAMATGSEDADKNLYEIIYDGQQVDEGWTKEKIEEKMWNRERFNFYYTDSNGNEKLLYFIPIKETIWYFLMVVERNVFTEQSRNFVFSSLTMLLASMAILIVILLLIMWNRNRAVKESAMATAKNEFLSNMSHEIRTPLNGIIGLLYLMRTHVHDKDYQQMSEWIDKANETANYLLRLVSDILDMSKFQAGKVELNEEPFMLEPMLDNVLSMQHNNAVSRGIELIFEKDITSPCIVGDEIRIKQVLMNIVSNAVKFTSEGGTIKLTVKQEKPQGDKVTTFISCEDNGVGMSSQFVKTIWDSFTQERNQHSDGTKGTGLGMAISKGFIDAMGGKIEVKSEVNVGSTFTITLPCKIGEISQIAPDLEKSDSKSYAAPAETVPMKLMIADDNELNAEILKRILVNAGHEVVCVTDGKQAVEEFSKSEPEEIAVILMDMQMPIMDGCQATKEIRKMERPDSQTVKIFACTANSFMEDKVKAIESGMDDFITKPIDVRTLFKKLENI